MARLPDSTPIEYLVRRKFPIAKALSIPPPLSSNGSSTGRLSGEERRRLLQEIEDYRDELEGKAAEEIASLVEAERAKEAAEIVARSRLEEQQGFSISPTQMPTIPTGAKQVTGHWTKRSHSLSERRRRL